MAVREVLRQVRCRRLGAVGLVVVWVLLWGSLSPIVLLGGVLVAILVIGVFPLPALEHRFHLRPLWILVLFARLLVDLVVSAVTVGWQAVRYGSRTRTGIVAVPLHVDSDLLIALTANVTSLTPGSYVLEIDRRHRVCYVHTLPLHGRSDAERQRREVWAVEERITRAVGTDEQVRVVLEARRRRERT
ncbi:hypothetical protein GCM10012275_22000 [Longimycelium tulufanense]|uniref:Na+/H+ antiporter subunit E n=1 Tax=Longimycelium tulufanense TaxID=907463 RepID=A0A8J3CDB7_9PSEU|nr:Na+/H+ antiporter subunit E [Longimycelium tulufanense]GGM50750.1 hypothetical protein GCM10012275_22000 [Longimycelium tulufanense]